jgi:hypothetical protein
MHRASCALWIGSALLCSACSTSVPPLVGENASSANLDASSTTADAADATTRNAPDAAIDAYVAPFDASAIDAASYDPELDGASAVDGGACTLTENTYATSNVNNVGCAVLDLDNSSCAASRIAAGVTGYWLKFSCRIHLKMVGAGQMATIDATFDGQPDHKSNYFPTANPCWESYTAAVQNPNLLAVQSYDVEFPLSPNMMSRPMMGVAVVGMALDGVPIYGNFAAPGDDIYQEAKTFDRCGGHPQGSGDYHYHCEPYAITDDDDRFVGAMRDGYPIYGRRDPDQSYPTLDTYGGHTGTTVDSPTTSVYHYHVNQQTSTASTSLGQKQWFLTTGTFRGSIPTCASCSN